MNDIIEIELNIVECFDRIIIHVKFYLQDLKNMASKDSLECVLSYLLIDKVCILRVGA